MKLNSHQKKAVEHTGAPLLIVAGAGTGKTSVITERIAELIEKHNVSPESILALTFTEKAANEMLERVDVRLPFGHSEATIRTFHGFCDQLLRQHGLEIGLNTGYRILTQVEAWMFFKEHLFDFPLQYFRPVGNPLKFISAVLSYFGRLQDEYVDPDTYETFAAELAENSKEEKLEKEKHAELASVYRQYLTMKFEKGMLEFSDLHYLTLKLFQKRQNILKAVQSNFAHILVDEFQDTNLIQFELIKSLSPGGVNLAVVADDDQSIYAFRGSNITNILQFTSHYPDTVKISLTTNYRSPQKLLDRAYTLIQNNNPDRLEVRENISKKLDAQSKHASDVSFQQFAEGHEEVNFICETIEKLRKEENLRYSDFVILIRANSYADPFLEELQFRGIPFQFPGLKGLYEREEVKYLLSFLRFLRNPHDSLSLFHILKLSAFGFEMEAILSIMRQQRMRKSSLWSVLKKIDDPKIQSKIKILEDLIEKSRETSGGQLLWEFAEKYCVPELLKNDTLENQKKILNITSFFEKVKSFEEHAAVRDIVSLIDFLDLMIEAGENPATAEGELDSDTVQVMTVHGSKGLEFEVVFMPSLVSQRFPSTNRSETIEFPDGLKRELLPSQKTNIAEERRLFYVACTRSRHHLFLTASTYYGSEKRPRKVSPFVSELGFDVIDGKEKRPSSSKKVPAEKPAPVQNSAGASLPSDHRRFSYSQIEDFRTCPRKYQYRHIYKLPDEGSPAMSLGSSLHNTLKKFYDYLKSREAPGLFDSQTVDHRDKLLAFYEESFDRSGYMNKKHLKESYEKGKDILIRFYEANGPEFALPYLQEKKFVLPIEDIILTGKFDRIDRVAGTTDEVEIIDYKSGKLHEQKDVDKNLQLSLYGLACRDALRLKPKKLSLYFLDDGVKIDSHRSDEQLNAVRDDFLRIAREILRSDFIPTPGQYVCTYCPYRHICDQAILS